MKILYYSVSNISSHLRFVTTLNIKIWLLFKSEKRVFRLSLIVTTILINWSRCIFYFCVDGREKEIHSLKRSAIKTGTSSRNTLDDEKKETKDSSSIQHDSKVYHQSNLFHLWALSSDETQKAICYVSLDPCSPIEEKKKREGWFSSFFVWSCDCFHQWKRYIFEILTWLIFANMHRTKANLQKHLLTQKLNFKFVKYSTHVNVMLHAFISNIHSVPISICLLYYLFYPPPPKQ